MGLGWWWCGGTFGSRCGTALADGRCEGFFAGRANFDGLLGRFSAARVVVDECARYRLVVFAVVAAGVAFFHAA